MLAEGGTGDRVGCGLEHPSTRAVFVVVDGCDAQGVCEASVGLGYRAG
jgi:hypothetical protein